MKPPEDEVPLRTASTEANDLSAMLWHERKKLGCLASILAEERTQLKAGAVLSLEHTARKTARTVEELRTMGLARALRVSALAREWNMNEDATLRELADHAPSGPWNWIFAAHLLAMTDLAQCIEERQDANERILRANIGGDAFAGRSRRLPGALRDFLS